MVGGAGIEQLSLIEAYSSIIRSLALGHAAYTTLTVLSESLLARAAFSTDALDWRISVAAWNEQCWLRLSFPRQTISGGYMLFMNWMKIAGDVAMLGFETQQVMHLRMMKIFAGGPKAQSEALRMVTEKGTALAEATMSLARGGSAQRVIRRYRTHVKSNRRRLSKP